MFAYKLAWVARTADVDGMLDGIDEQVFQEWRAYDAYICPIGPERLDAAMAAFMAIVARYLGGIAGEEKHIIADICPQAFCSWLNDDDEEPEVDEATAAIAARVNMESAILMAQANLRR